MSHEDMEQTPIRTPAQQNDFLAEYLDFKMSNLWKGALIGGGVSAFVSWNSGKYSKLGTFIKLWTFTRNFVRSKSKFTSFSSLTNYHRPNLTSVASNFICLSGESGIGKSIHFEHLVRQESYIRPSLYVALKSVGRPSNFQHDLSEQLHNDTDGGDIFSDIIFAVKKIKKINKNPFRFVLKCQLPNLLLLTSYFLISLIQFSSITSMWPFVLYSGIFLTQAYYNYFITPLIKQAYRRTTPFIVFDDMNKMQHMGMLAQIVRFLRLIQMRDVNIILVSSDEETWSQLRREPGMKDRLRLKQIVYDHEETSKRSVEAFENQFQKTYKTGDMHPAFKDKTLLIEITKQLIGQKQMTLRRFSSLLRLTDQQEFQKLVSVLESKELQNKQKVQKFTSILLNNQIETMVSSLKMIRRQRKDSSEEEYIQILEQLIKKEMLMSDCVFGPNLKIYNIVRDLRSDYVINGRFTWNILKQALKEYKKYLKEYRQ